MKQKEREAVGGLPHVAVVIPLYNEGEHIGRVIRGVPGWVRSILVVDDASPDDSLPRAREAADGRVHFLCHKENQGVGAATLTGFSRAVELGARVLVKMDGDGQMDPDNLLQLIKPIVAGEADYTKGNRFLHSRQIGEMPLLRRLGNLGLSFLTKLASGYWNIFDPTNGYTAIHADVLPLLESKALHRRFFFETSMLLELGLVRAVIHDVLMPARYGPEKSTLSESQAILRFPVRLLSCFLRRIWTQYFLRDFGLFTVFFCGGLLLFMFGAGFGAYHWYQAWLNQVPTHLGTIMISVLPIILGVQFLLQAIILDVQGIPTRVLQRELASVAALENRLEQEPGPDGE